MLGTAFQADQEELAIAQEMPRRHLPGLPCGCASRRPPTPTSARRLSRCRGSSRARPSAASPKGGWAKYGPYIAKVQQPAAQHRAARQERLGAAAPRRPGAIYTRRRRSARRASRPRGNVPRPMVEMQFDSITASTTPTTTPNTGSTAEARPRSATSPTPVRSRALANVPPGGGPGSVDFGKDTKASAVDLLRAPAAALKGLKSFSPSRAG